MKLRELLRLAGRLCKIHGITLVPIDRRSNDTIDVYWVETDDSIGPECEYSTDTGDGSGGVFHIDDDEDGVEHSFTVPWESEDWMFDKSSIDDLDSAIFNAKYMLERIERHDDDLVTLRNLLKSAEYLYRFGSVQFVPLNGPNSIWAYLIADDPFEDDAFEGIGYEYDDEYYDDDGDTESPYTFRKIPDCKDDEDPAIASLHIPWSSAGWYISSKSLERITSRISEASDLLKRIQESQELPETRVHRLKCEAMWRKVLHPEEGSDETTQTS